MANDESIRRKILTFALVRHNFSNSTDPIAALGPFFAPIANDYAEQVFDSITFRAQMRDRYGIPLSRDVTELFIQRLIALNYLRHEPQRGYVWVRQANEHNSPPEAEENRLSKIIDAARKFHAGRIDLLQEEFSEEKFLGGLMGILLDVPALQSAVETIENIESGATVNNTAGNAGPRIKDASQYFAAEFIRSSRESDPELFDWIADLGGAAMVSEALIEIRTPVNHRPISTDLTVYLDAPFVMELLGCSGSAARADAKYIVDRLQGQGVVVAVLKHSIEELETNIRAVLKTPPHQRRGPSALAIINQEVTEQYLGDVLSDPEHFLEQIRVQVIDPNLLKHLQSTQFFSNEDEHNFFAAIQGQYNNIGAAERDAASVAWIMRRRRGEYTRDVLKSKHIFLTRNKLIYRTINRYVREKGFGGASSAGPVILARDLAGILWLLVGEAERHEISKRQLILGCQRARANAPEIVSAMYETIRAINVESAELFWASVRRPSYLSMALDAVAGSAIGVTADAADAVLEKIREDLTAEERSRGKLALKRAADKYQQDVALKEVIISSIDRERAVLLEKSRDHLNHWRGMSRSIWLSIAQRARALSVLYIMFGAALILSSVAVAAAIGSDAVTLPPYIEAGVSVVFAVLLLFLSISSSKHWVLARIERVSQNAYIRQVSATVPEDVKVEVIVHAPMTAKSLWRTAILYKERAGAPDVTL